MHFWVEDFEFLIVWGNRRRNYQMQFLADKLPARSARAITPRLSVTIGAASSI
jgi:hypothetical protein